MAEKKPSAKKPPDKQQSAKQPAKSDKQPAKAVDKKATAKPAPPPKKKSRGCLFYIILLFLATAVILGAAVAAAEYLGIISLKSIKEDVGQKYQLQNYPVVGKYFPPVETNFEPVPLAEDGVKPVEPLPVPSPPVEAKKDIITLADIEKEEKRKQDEAAKRVSRLARLYGEMKPANAVEVIKELDDNTVLTIFAKMEDDQVAKILSLLEAERAARLTEDMLKGQN